jgi:hypothetical protein
MTCPAKKHLDRMKHELSYPQIQLMEIAYRNCSETCRQFGKKLGEKVIQKAVEKQTEDDPTTSEETRKARKR